MDSNPCAGFRPGWFPRSRNSAQGLLSLVSWFPCLPTPNPDAAADADLVELVPLTVHVGALRI
jgi:hypothetical protein